jgi:hypothetical protein
MKNVFKTVMFSMLLGGVLYPSLVFSQKQIIPSDSSIIIFGAVEKGCVYHISDLDTFKSSPIADQILYNHKGEIKDSIKNLYGVKLKDLLKKIKFVYSKPKELNEFYFVLRASDGYTVVLSWNEVYNHPAGEHFFIVTKMNGKNIHQMEQRILFLSDGDLRASRRYIKGFTSLEVKRVN